MAQRSRRNQQPPERSRTESRGGGSSSWWSVPIAAAFVAGYLVLFYSSEPLHWQGLTMALLPDELIRQWMGGGWQRVGWADRLPVLLMASAILATATLLGCQLLRWLRCEQFLTPLEHGVLGCALGLSGLSLWTLAMGLAGQLGRPWLVGIPPVLLAAWSAARGYRAWKQAGQSDDAPAGTARSTATAGTVWSEVAASRSEVAAGTSSEGSRDGLERYGLWLAAPLVVILTMGSLLPPWEFDVREYHLQIPKEWYQQGYIGFVPHNVYGNMPLGAEMHALLAMVLWPGGEAWWWGALVGKTVIGACAGLTSLTLYAMGRRWFGRVAGVVAAVLYLAIPWVAQVSMAGLIDGVVGLYAVQAIHLALIWSASRSELRSPWQVALLCGLLAGSAAACKYPALVFVVLPLAVWILFGRRRADLRGLAIFGLAVVLGCGLWLGKNWILAGNPTYPLLASTLGGKTRTAERIQQWSRAHQVPPDAQGRRYTVAQGWGSLRQIGWRSPWLGPLLVPLAGLSLLRRWARNQVLPLFAWLLYGLTVWWLATHRIDRFLVPMLPVAALLAGAGATWTERREWRAIVVAGLTWCVLAGGLMISSRLFPADNRFLVALHQLRPDLPSEQDPHFYFTDPVHAWLNRHVPAGKRVLLVGDAQPFDLEVAAVYGTCFDACPLERLLGDARSGPERRAALHAAGISHVYVKWSELDRYRSPGNYGFSDFVTRPRIREEFVERQGVLRPVPLPPATLPLDPQRGQLFEVSELP